VNVQPLTDDGLYDLLDTLGFDTSHRARERAELERRVFELEQELEDSNDTVDSLEETVRVLHNQNEVLKARLKTVKSATADA
jgi:CII-binding regulator of phage lambda lysogenization HflD